MSCDSYGQAFSQGRWGGERNVEGAYGLCGCEENDGGVHGLEGLGSLESFKEPSLHTGLRGTMETEERNQYRRVGGD